MRLTKSIILAKSVALLALVSLQAQAQDYSQWLGREAKDMASARNQFNTACEKKNLSLFIKKKSPKEIAVEWTKSTCNCIGNFIKEKQDLTYFQTVNAFLNDRLKANGEPPKDLYMYLDGYADVLERCGRDPKFKYERDEASDDPALLYMNPDGTMNDKPRMKNDKSNPKGIPFRPQKNEQKSGKSRKFSPTGSEEGVE